MIRTFFKCMPLLVLSATAAADTVEGVATPREPEQKSESSKADRNASTPAPEAQSATSKEADDVKDAGEVQMSGMSVLGNDEAPKSLVIVPWKSSQLGDTPGLSKLLDDSTQPVDKDVFMRELAYYQIKSSSK
jgi:hypothetical protein